MRIAFSVDKQGQLQDFGTTTFFQIYDTNTHKKELLNTSGIAYGALAVLLDNKEINKVYCLSISKGSEVALKSNQIEVELSNQNYKDILEEMKKA